MDEDLNETDGQKPPDLDLFNLRQQQLNHQISFSSQIFQSDPSLLKLENFDKKQILQSANQIINLAIILKEDKLSNPMNSQTDMIQSIEVPVTEAKKINIVLKYRQQQKSLLERLFEEQKIQEIDGHGNTSQQKNKRVKERTIKEVVEKVALWRKIYCGFINEFGKIVQQPLDVSATKIGIAKKTLDDYLFQIRLGKKFGFDFNLNKDEKIGKLRTFVKDNRNKTEIQKRPRKQVKKEEHDIEKSY